MTRRWSTTRERAVQQDDSDIVSDAEVVNFEGDVTVTDEGDGKVTVTVGETGQFKGKLIDFTFGSGGNASDKYMNTSSNGNVPSNEAPLIMPQDGVLVALTFINSDDNVDQDIEVYTNGILVFTWGIRNKRWAWKTDLSGMVTTLQGDRISIFSRKYSLGTGDPTVQNPILEVFFQLTSNYENEGGGQTGVT